MKLATQAQDWRGKIIHEHEKILVVEILKLSHLAIRDENILVRSIRAEVANFIRQNCTLPKEPTKTHIRDVANKWAKILSNQTKCLDEYFLSLTDYGGALAQIIQREYRKIAEELGKEELQEAEGYRKDSKLFRVDKAEVRNELGKTWAADGKSYHTRLEELSAGASPIFDRIFRQGMEEGKGYKQIVRDLRKQINVDAYKLERIVRTEGQWMQNQITLKTMKKNANYIMGIEYTAALDVRTCVVCGSNDRNRYWIEGGAPSIGDAPNIPVHPLCRCTYVPISKFWSEGGLLADESAVERASMFGPVSGDYNDFLKRVGKTDPEWVKKHLGKFYDKWKAGVSINTLKLIDGRPKVAIKFTKAKNNLPRTDAEYPLEPEGTQG